MAVYAALSRLKRSPGLCSIPVESFFQEGEFAQLEEQVLSN